MNKSFWRNKKVFITGHTGFKGAWLTYWLCKAHARITGYALNPVQDSFYENLDFTSIHDIRADILDKDMLQKELSNTRPEIVIHLAAKSTLLECLNSPLAAYQTNIIGLINLLESIKQCDSVKTVLLVTSDKVYYGDCPADGFAENQTLLGAMDHYSATKSCQENIVDSYRNSVFKSREIGVATARASNVLGCGDYFKDRLIPTMLENFKLGRTVEIRNPNAIRPWQNILDCLDGYLCLCEKLYSNCTQYSGAWNIGPFADGMRTVEWLAEEIASYWGSPASYKIIENKNPVPEKLVLKINISKALTLLEWKPKWLLTETLRQLVRFEKALIKGESFGNLIDNIIYEHEIKSV